MQSDDTPPASPAADMLEIIYEALNDAGMIETTQDAEYAAEKVHSAVVAALSTPPASPAEREQYAWDTCAQLVRSFNALDEHQRGGLLAAIALYRNQRSLATPPASPADMAAFGASDAACYLYPGADQQAERAAFCEGAAHAVSTPPATPPACPAEPDKFRKKPVVVVAHRLGDDGWPDEIWDGVTRNEIILHLDRDAMKRVTGHAEIRTMEGVMRANVGDWIIRGVKGEFYPCKPDIFAATYEPATSPASPAATDEEVARMVERLRKPVYTFHINEKGGPNITVEGENRFAMEREVSLLADAGREAADLLARVARERDIAQEAWQHEHERAEKAKAMIKHMVGISDDMATVFIDGFGDVALDYDDARLKRAEAAEKVLRDHSIMWSGCDLKCSPCDCGYKPWLERVTAHLTKLAGGNNG